MKTTAAVLAAMMMTATVHAGEPGYFSESAKYTVANKTAAEKAYCASLKSDNEGVRESALAHVAVLELSTPEPGSREVRACVERIARTASSDELRYKAFLVGVVMEHPEIFRNLSRDGYAAPDELYAALASRLGEFYAAR